MMRDRAWLSGVVVASATVIALVAGGTDTRGQASEADAELARHERALSDFLTAWLPRYAATVATERYVQTAMNSRTELESEFAAVQFDGEWVGVRDVHRVNGRTIPDREGRVARLFTMRDKEPMRRLIDRIAAESARFNIGDVARTVNNPSVIMDLLDPAGRRGFRVQFSDGEYERTTPLWVMRFAERTRPTLIRTETGADVPAKGRVWMEASGAVARVEVTVPLVNVAGYETGRTATVNLDFADDATIGLRVPVRMREIYASPTGFALVRGDARYTDYRTFDVEAREQLERIEGGP